MALLLLLTMYRYRSQANGNRVALSLNERPYAAYAGVIPAYGGAISAVVQERTDLVDIVV